MHARLGGHPERAGELDGKAVSPKNLSTYRRKRDFEKTAEPSGEIAVAPSKRRRFVIQKHDATRLHYDLRLEFDGVFKSWAVTRGPSLDPNDKRLAVEVEDHPLDYGDFEGTIPEGQYGGGTVQLWDRGYWEPEGAMTPEEALAKGDLKFTLDGERLHGSWVLVRMRHDRNGGKRTNWLLIKHRDDFARTARPTHPGRGPLRRLRPDDGADRRRQGQGAEAVHAGDDRGAARADAVWDSRPAAMPQDARADVQPLEGDAAPCARPAAATLPDFVAPQLCTPVERPPAGDGWVPRDQVRRLPRAVARRGRRGHAQDPQGPGLDRQVRARSPRRRDRCRTR